MNFTAQVPSIGFQKIAHLTAEKKRILGSCLFG
jgi:hypothetical protein